VKIKLLFLLCFYSLTSLAQGEANIWYFGDHAGLDFNSGNPIPLTDGQLVTQEGCATISNAAGKLLFYTDGTTIYNRNHQIMINGSGLMGHSSSTQSATIVPKPGSSSLFYVFTLDASARANGFRYSIVDITLDGGLGGVTSDKNVLIYTPSCEKISIVKHANSIDFWVITHGFNNDLFYAHLLTSAGLNTSAVISKSGIIVNQDNDGYNSMGYMKIAPNGSKLILCHQFLDTSELFDFNNSSGVVSNPKVLLSNYGQFYGAEFSPNSEVLYLLTQIGRNLYQFDLTAPNVASSVQVIHTFSKFLGALQLGPDKKIYIAVYEQSKLSVINNPDALGVACNLQIDSIDLAGKICKLGLPAFNQSFFFESDIQLTDACAGQNTHFELKTNQTISSASWDFGDGVSSTAISPTHQYTAEGTYTISVIATSPSGSSVKTRDIIISKVPAVTQPQNLLVCDTNNDGLYSFDLTSQNVAIRNGQDPTSYRVNYFANGTDYANNKAIVKPGAYVNQNAYQAETIIAEVSNNENSTCKSTTSFVIDVFDTPKPNVATNITNLYSCDNTSAGTDTDGRVVFDITQRADVILNGQSVAQFFLSYFKDAALTQSIAFPTAYQNTNATETIYVKMVNKDNVNCSATTSFTIQVFALPVITTVVDLKQCDDDIDGFSIFNLEEAIPKITNNASSETISFFRTQSEAQSNTNPIVNTATYANQTVSNDAVYVRVSNSNSCFRIAKLNLIVSTTQIPLNFTHSLTECDDSVSGTNTDGITTFDFSSVTNQIQAIFPVGQQLDITYYRNLNDALAEKNSISNIANYRNIGYPTTQNIYIRVDSRLNNDCLGLGSHITLNVESIPITKSIIETQCDDDQDGSYGFDTSTIQTNILNGLTNFTVTYLDQNFNPLSSPLPNPFITGSQMLKVLVTNNTPTACSFSSTIQFIVSDLPEAFPVPVTLTTVCDDEADPNLQNGKYGFDTSTFQNTILNGQTGMTVRYFDGNNNPLSSPLPNPFLTATQNVRVEVINPLNNTCEATVIIPFIVNPVPNINLVGDELVCSNLPTFTKIIDAGIQDGSPIADYSYVWFFNGNRIEAAIDYTLTVNTEGIYTVEVTNNKGCSRMRTITVLASDIAKITDVNIIDLADSNSITISVSGSGDYVYSLDNEYGDYQTEAIFSNINAGIHTVFVKDLNGCGIVPKEVAVLGIPDYFTPNQDGYNDTWNIKGVNTSFNAKTTVHIFNRYGKLLKEISPIGEGWNGTFNGQSLPSDDYWYSIELEDGRVMKGHFALKR
jgi:gliding motility-associated-like protein